MSRLAIAQGMSCVCGEPATQHVMDGSTASAVTPPGTGMHAKSSNEERTSTKKENWYSAMRLLGTALEEPCQKLPARRRARHSGCATAVPSTHPTESSAPMMSGKLCMRAHLPTSPPARPQSGATWSIENVNTAVTLNTACSAPGHRYE
jgi:hypothetical protein